MCLDIKTGKYYLVRATILVYVREITPSGITVQTLSPYGTSRGAGQFLPDAFARRVYKLKEGVQYLTRSGATVSVAASGDSAFPWIGYIDGLPQMYTPFGCIHLNHSASDFDIVGKVAN